MAEGLFYWLSTRIYIISLISGFSFVNNCIFQIMRIILSSPEPVTENCKCAFCNKTIAIFQSDVMIPSVEECYKEGNVPIPNFGWFCSQSCAFKYEEQSGIMFQKTEYGIIDYYK